MLLLRKTVKTLISLSISFAIALLLMEGVLRFLPVREVPHTAELNDADPIPHYVPNMDGYWSRDWNFSLVNEVHVNNFGFVNDQEYVKDDPRPLVAVIGDSFVASLMVPYPQTFHGLLASHFSDQLRVYSFGLSGAPLPTYLKWAEYAVEEFGAQYLVFTIITNDYDESYYKYKGFPAFYYFYPDAEGSLQLDKEDFYITPWRRNLVRTSRLMAYLTQNVQIRGRIKDLLRGGKTLIQGSPYDSKRMAESKTTIDFFLQELEMKIPIDKSRILFVVDAVEEFIFEPNTELNTRPGFEIALNAYFITHARRAGFPVVSLQTAFSEHYRQHHERFDFPTDGHWNPMAHEIVYNQILQSSLLADHAPTGQ